MKGNGFRNDSAMLSELEKREMKEMAASTAVREEFELLRKLSQFDPHAPMELDQLVNWLSAMNRCFPSPPPRPFVPYARVLL